jgi:hypothetical protein
MAQGGSDPRWQLSEEQRTMLVAKNFMRAGEFTLALTTWRSLDSEPDLVRQLEELTCLYQLGRFYDWNKEVSRLQKRLGSILAELIEPDEFKHRALWLIAKNLEEGGWLAEALGLMEVLGQDDDYRAVRDAYVLRVSLQYKLPAQGLSELYRSLLAYRRAGSEDPRVRKFTFDIQQAIALYEARYVSDRLACARGEKQLEALLIAQDASVLFVDLLEAMYEAQGPAPAFLAQCDQFAQNTYERKLLQILKTRELADPLFLFSQMPTANALRLSALYLRQNDDELLRALCAEVVLGLGGKNRKLWGEFFGWPAETAPLVLKFQRSQLIVKGERIPLTPLLERLIEVLLESNGRVSTDLAISKVWNEAPGESQLERLKAATHRINKLLGERIDIEKAISFTKNELRLVESVRIERAG